MNNNHNVSLPSTSGCAKPLHIQRIEQALDMSILETHSSNPQSVSEEENQDFGLNDNNYYDSADLFKDTDDADLGDGMYFNFDELDMERSWLHDVMLEDDNEENYDICDDVNCDMKFSMKQKKITKNAKPDILEQNMYYGAGILSNFDKYPEYKKTTQGKALKRKREDTPTKNPYITEMFSEEDQLDLELENSLSVQNLMAEEPQIKLEHPVKPNYTRKSKIKKFKDEESKKKWEEIMLQKRRKFFSSLVKKEVGKQQRAKMSRHKEALVQTKKMALACQKFFRNKALQSARAVKELQWRMKRLSRENLSYWKRSKRADREIRRKLEKEAEEQRKIDFELIEAKRQQRKLNFLITQTELYAHFMSKKLGEASPEEQLRILSQLDEEKNPRLATIDDYDCDKMKAKAIKNAHDAFQYEKARTRQFDITAEMDRKGLDTIDGEFPQPEIFKGTLKAYQLRGMNWLANLYDQGISGILADEMGLGKTVQSIAFLSHLAEFQDLWGPFLVICPASTLHNWQQEFAKFVPSFKVVPYWGNPADRKILRQFWHQDGMHTKDAGFHVVITSYQIVISDVKYFNRIKWQYMILDEAQAIKSTSSMRWKTLLGFNCRNRLLLSGTPIQNSMAELWALLHFIMPTLFDSHEEFNEWFSKDIESHAENKTGIDEKHLSRLHMILKPFMLRRIKKDVENELSDKIEIMVYCPLTTRQRLLYMALKQKIHIEDLLHYTVGGGDSHSIDKNFTSNLMNLVMQFRKVCNHPELFERRDAKSPIFLPAQFMAIPYLVYDTNVRKEKLMVLQKHFLFSKEYISKAITDPYSIFNFCLALRMSAQEIYTLFQGNILTLWKCGFQLWNLLQSQFIRINYSNNFEQVTSLLGAFMKMSYFIYFDSALDEIMLTKHNTAKKVIYNLAKHSYHSMPETLEHRNIRCKNNAFDFEVVDSFSKNNQGGSANEFPYHERKPQTFMCEKTEMPSFLFSGTPKLTVQLPQLYCYSRRAAYDYKRHIDDWSLKALNYYWTQSTNNEYNPKGSKTLYPSIPSSPIEVIRPVNGWSNIFIPDKETLVTDSGKLTVLDRLLKKLKEEGHRVLIYSQMTKMIDLLEEYMWHRHHKYMRLDGSSKISERRDMVADFQARTDIFVFLLSTRAGGLGINLTAADTVIFYDSDWNPTVDQQAMDRAHRLGQTKQVTVYRLICKGSIEERILQRAREKSEIQNLVISGGNFKPETLKPKEVVSLLLDDEEIELKYRQRAEERKHMEDMRELDRKRKYAISFKNNQISSIPEVKKIKTELNSDGETYFPGESSPRSENSTDVQASDDLSDNILDVETWDNGVGYNLYSPGVNKIRTPPRGSSKRGRPRGSRRASALGRFNTSSTHLSSPSSTSTSTISENPVSDSLTYGFENPGSSTITSQIANSNNSLYSGGPSIRRGPGRPRLKPTGSANTGSRGTYRPRKPARPLPVPLPSDGSTSSTSYSYFNTHEQSDM